MPTAEPLKFKVGDIVTRDGTDRHRILELTDDCLTVECIQEPFPCPGADGKPGEPWIRLGEIESNLIRRYQYPDDAIHPAEVPVLGGGDGFADWNPAHVRDG